MTNLPNVPGIISAHDVARTVDAIAGVQLANGNIPWTPGGHTDPWNLVEAAMALDVGGRHDAARAAYEWLAAKQNADGSWHAYYLGDDVEDPTLDTNVSCYLASGAWHHYLSTDDLPYLRRQWPAIEGAIDWALDFQRETGEIAWRGDDPDDGALLTGSSSIHLSLKCAIAIAEQLGYERPDWELSLGALATAIAHRPDVFLEKSRWAMDWYYPILGGVLRGQPAQVRIAEGAPRFVVGSRGVRCVSDCPWITAAETCEFVMALDALGNDEQALALYRAVQFLRDESGGYWTGANFEGERFDAEGEHYPQEQPTWNSAAVVLAAEALSGDGPRAGMFRGEHLPEGLTAAELLAAGTEIARERAAER
ncbi:MAG TPA: prenyltransferase [Acidimicrobiia bacterium]|nr:prenyltransferase [Acidimicrobiia bacterium]